MPCWLSAPAGRTSPSPGALGTGGAYSTGPDEHPAPGPHPPGRASGSGRLPPGGAGGKKHHPPGRPHPRQPGRYLWQGDITTLVVDAIVNAANRQLLGCFVPCHGCIDNAIHSAAGMELRQACAQLMARQGHGRHRPGQAHPGLSPPLPVRSAHRRRHHHRPRNPAGPGPAGQLLRACLALAEAHGLASVAFCCISTGEFHLPNDLAARIAVDTVSAWQRDHPGPGSGVQRVRKTKNRQSTRPCSGEGGSRPVSPSFSRRKGFFYAETEIESHDG